MYSMQYKICIDLVHNFLVFNLWKRTMRKRFINLPILYTKSCNRNQQSLALPPTLKIMWTIPRNWNLPRWVPGALLNNAQSYHRTPWLYNFGHFWIGNPCLHNIRKQEYSSHSRQVLKNFTVWFTFIKGKMITDTFHGLFWPLVVPKHKINFKRIFYLFGFSKARY